MIHTYLGKVYWTTQTFYESMISGKKMFITHERVTFKYNIPNIIHRKNNSLKNVLNTQLHCFPW